MFVDVDHRRFCTACTKVSPTMNSGAQAVWFIQIHKYEGSLLKVAFINNKIAVTKPSAYTDKDDWNKKVCRIIQLVL